MIRARDFLLYLVVLTFLLLVMIFTVRSVPNGIANPSSRNSDPQFLDGTEFIIDKSEQDIDRDQNRANLRAKLAKGSELNDLPEPVFTSVDTPVSAPESDPNIDSEINTPDETQRLQKFCPTILSYEDVLANWNNKQASLSVQGDRRLLIGKEIKIVTVGSSTNEVLVDHIYLDLPVKPFRDLSSNCLDSEVIGVALDGNLIKNSDTWKFRNYSSDVLLGYARDGIPIYGQGVDEALLDTCGGYDNGIEYRYYLREKELFVLACFDAKPQPIIK
jgi:hypothetical protein